MRVLLMEGEPGVAASAIEHLRAAGHVVLGCEPGDPSVPCRGLEPVADCPLDGHVDVAVVARTDGPIRPSERGGLCAARHRVPVVVAAGDRTAGSAGCSAGISFGPGTHVAGADLVATCTAAARSGVAHVAAVRRELLMSGVIQPAEVVGNDPAISFDVLREPRRIRLTIRAPRGDPRIPSLTKSAAEALRRFDPWSPVIDVIVSPT